MRPTSSRSRLWRRSFVAALLVLGVLAAPAGASVFGPPHGHSPNADTIRTTYWVMLVVTTIIAVVAIGALLVAAFRFRERREEPRRLSAGRGAIARVAIGLGVICVVLFIFGVVMTDKAKRLEASGPNGLQANNATLAQVGVDGIAPVTESDVQSAENAAGTDTKATGGDVPTGPLQINAIAQQWLWRFEYPGGRQGQRVFTYGQLIVPVDTAVVLNVTSTDVLHSWFVPDLGGQVMAVPGKVSQTWFKADSTGVYSGNSTEFSGTSFPAMRPTVDVVTPTQYQAYLEQLQKDLTSAQLKIKKVQAKNGANETVSP